MPLDHSEALEKLKRLPDRLDRFVEDHPNDLLCQPGAGGGWGAIEIMAFLRDWDEVVTERLNRMLTEHEPEIEDEDPDLWPIERDYHAEDPAKVVTEFRDHREKLVGHLEQLDPETYQRTGRMPDGTTITVEDLVENLVASDQQHVSALRDMLS